ncbi:MAG: TRAP transporter substrate-binding protein DctP [Clostridiales bacterium]|nr:TRAP transporter substrate-binding protein DctP [Clostridiales bacterium]
MKKKVLSLIMVIAVLASFGLMSACGTTETPAAATTAAATPADTAAATTADTAAAPATVEPLTIKFSSTFQETETGGAILTHFMDKVKELSGGAITVNMSWGGTLFPSADELDAVSSGSVDMIALGHMPHLSTLNYLSFPSFAPGGTQAALDFFDTLILKDPTTSALIQGEAKENGIRYLNVIAGGANAFCTKYAFTDLASMVKGSTSFGNFDAAIFEALGFQVTMIAPPDAYDALNRGLINSTQMGFAPMVAMSWYEVAPYWAFDDTYAAGNMFTVNLAWWDKLSDAQKKAIQDAATDTQAFSATIYDGAISKDQALVEEKTGNKFVQLSDADKAAIWAANFEAKAKAALDTCAKSGKTEGMTKILEKAAEITKYDWKH